MVYKLPHMVDMAASPERGQSELLMPVGVDALHDRYPYGLCISLTQDDLAKLDLDSDCEIGDMIHMFAMGKVTSISKSANASAKDDNCRIEIQITHLGLEDEDHENAGEDKGDAPKRNDRAQTRYGSDDDGEDY